MVMVWLEGGQGEVRGTCAPPPPKWHHLDPPPPQPTRTVDFPFLVSTGP